MFGQLKPWYSFILFLPNGIVLEANNFAGGNSASYIGINVTLGMHFGYYECLDNNMVHVVDTGYVYRSPSVPFLNGDGGTVVYNYYLQFSDQQATRGNGTIASVLFQTGSNPLSPSNNPIFIPANGTTTCEFLNGTNFQIPTTIA